jgi:hypothetical protein
VKKFLAAILIAATLAFPALAGAADGPLRFANATYTSPPICTDAYFPALNPTTPLHVCAIVRRPETGGGLHKVTVFLPGDKLVLGEVDTLNYGYEDCFGADLWPSNFSHKILFTLNCKPTDTANGNDRDFPVVPTDIPAYPAYQLAPPPAQ